MNNVAQKLWTEKYRPKNFDECILPKQTKEIFEGFIQSGEMPNLILHSRKAGTGKTTSAKLIGELMGYDVLFLNASLENGIDVLRNKITTFASSMSFSGAKKVVILDEADNLVANSMQKALRGFIESFSANVRFIFTCNHVEQLIEPLQSRCTVIDFNIPTAEKKDLLRQSLNRIEFILKNEGIEYNQKAVAKLLMQYFPDLRRTINDLQRYSSCGSIDEGITFNADHDNFSKLVNYLRTRNFKDMRLWIANNKDIPPERIYSYFYDNAEKILENESIPQMIITNARYQYMQAFVVDTEINTTAFLTELMANCKFKVEE